MKFIGSKTDQLEKKNGTGSVYKGKISSSKGNLSVGGKLFSRGIHSYLFIYEGDNVVLSVKLQIVPYITFNI